MNGQYYDISPKLNARLAVFPGDQPFQRAVAMDFHKGDHLALSSMQTTLHIGAHADAPSHYQSGGESIDQRDLSLYIGPCTVIRVSGLKPGVRIGPEVLHGRNLQPRVLFATDSFNQVDQWKEDFSSLSPELLEKIAQKGVCLVGIDTPSVDPHDSKKLESHQILARRNLAVLEGLFLFGVPEGDYLLVALPLAIEGGDASPVRAALWPFDHQFR